MEQVFVQEKIDEVTDEARNLGESAEVPGDLRVKVEERLGKDTATTWDEVVREIAIRDVEDEEDEE